MVESKQRFLEEIKEVCGDHGMVIATHEFSGFMQVVETGFNSKPIDDMMNEITKHTEDLDRDKF